MCVANRVNIKDQRKHIKYKLKCNVALGLSSLKLVQVAVTALINKEGNFHHSRSITSAGVFLTV